MFITGTPFDKTALDLLLVSLALGVVLGLLGLVTESVLGGIETA